MGIHLDEIIPLDGMSKEATKAAANDLWNIAQQNAITGLSLGSDGAFNLSETNILQVFESLGTSYSSNGASQNLMQIGWLEDLGGGRFRPTALVGQISTAQTAPRMTFTEARDQLTGLQRRLEKAPSALDGIHVKEVFLYGSATRDKNTRPTIGDLDLSVHFGFDARYDGTSHEQKIERAKSAWNSIISNGDERLSFGDAKLVAMEVMGGQETPLRPFGLLRVWSNPQSVTGTLSPEELFAVDARHNRTIATEQRAYQLAQHLENQLKQSDFPDEVVKPFLQETERYRGDKKTGAYRLSSPITPEESRQLILTALDRFHPTLGTKARAVFEAGYDDAVHNDFIDDLAVESLSNGASRWQVRTGEGKVMRSIPAGAIPEFEAGKLINPGNPNAHSVIQFDHTGTIDSVIYLSHELGHSMGDDYLIASGHDYRDWPKHMDETQAYYVQNIVRDHLANNLDLSVPRNRELALAARRQAADEMQLLIHLAHEPPRPHYLHERPLPLMTATTLYDHIRGAPSDERLRVSEAILGKRGPKGIAEVMSLAGLDSTNLGDAANKSISSVKNTERLPVAELKEDSAQSKTTIRTSGFSGSRRLGASAHNHPTINIVVDVQYGTDPAFIKRVRQSVDSLREEGIHTVWLTMAGDDITSRIYDAKAGTSTPYGSAELEKMGFFGHDPRPGKTDSQDLQKFREMFPAFGPRTDEAVFPKKYFDGFDALTDEGEGLAAYLNKLGVKHITLMGGNADVCVTETAIGAVRNGFGATILSDHLVRDRTMKAKGAERSADPAGKNPPAQYERELRDLHDTMLTGPKELSGDASKQVYVEGKKTFTAEERTTIREKLRFSTVPAFLKSEQLPAENLNSINAKLGIASLAINLTDAAIKGDPVKAAEIVGGVAVLEGGTRVISKIVGARVVPFAGQILGAAFAGKDAYDSAKSGHITRAVASGAEATLYSIATTASVATIADCWNPTAIVPAAVVLVAGGAAVTMTMGRSVYDNWNTVSGWFGHHDEAIVSKDLDPLKGPRSSASVIPVPVASRGSDFGSLRVATTNQTERVVRDVVNLSSPQRTKALSMDVQL